VPLVLELVAPVPDVPVVPLALPFSRQPVRVTDPLELWSRLLDEPLVCAAMVAVVNATATNVAPHMCLFMLCLLNTKSPSWIQCNPDTALKSARRVQAGHRSLAGKSMEKRTHEHDRRLYGPAMNYVAICRFYHLP
jgi:hypothetical protein